MKLPTNYGVMKADYKCTFHLFTVHLDKFSVPLYCGASTKSITVLLGLGETTEPPTEGTGEKNSVILKQIEMHKSLCVGEFDHPEYNYICIALMENVKLTMVDLNLVSEVGE